MKTEYPVLMATLLCLQLATSGAAHGAEPDEVLLLAEDIGRWISSTAVPHASGLVWPDNALAPETVSYNLASGVAGKVVYFTALYRATGKEEYLHSAKQGADYLISVIGDLAQFDGDQRRASLYAGLSGIGVSLLHVRGIAPEPKYDAALRRLLEILDDWGIEDDNGMHWSEQFNDLLYGDTGTVLFLTQLANLDGYSRAAEMAVQGGRFLLSQSIDENDESHWLFRRDKSFNLPNFSHGTAGVAYVLATAGAQADDMELLRGARAGFKYVRSVAEVADGRLRVPYGWGLDQWQGLYEFGWAHGLTGSSLMFLRMQELDVDADQAEGMLSLSRSTLGDINLPGTAVEPFAEPSMPLEFRFGRAGVLPLASFWAARNPDDQNIVNLRDNIFNLLQSTAIRDGDTAHWLVDAPEFLGGGQVAYTGVLHGAAGIGLALLSMHASVTGQDSYADMPDSPL